MRNEMMGGLMVLSLVLMVSQVVAAEGVSKEDQAVIAAQLPTYPLDTCVVAGGKLGSMGEPVNYVHKGRLVRFCCKGCIGAFEKNPAKYLKKIDEAASEKPKEKSVRSFIQYPEDSYLDYQYE